MAPHSGTLAWKIPWTEEPGRLQSMGSLSWTQLSDFTFTFHFHALEKEMATHSSVLAWRIPGTGEPSGLPSMESHRVGHDWSDLAAVAAATSLRTELGCITLCDFDSPLTQPILHTTSGTATCGFPSPPVTENSGVTLSHTHTHTCALNLISLDEVKGRFTWQPVSLSIRAVSLGHWPIQVTQERKDYLRLVVSWASWIRNMELLYETSRQCSGLVTFFRRRN